MTVQAEERPTLAEERGHPDGTAFDRHRLGGRALRKHSLGANLSFAHLEAVRSRKRLPPHPRFRLTLISAVDLSLVLVLSNPTVRAQDLEQPGDFRIAGQGSPRVGRTD